MKTKNNPLTLSAILLNAYGHDSESSNNQHGEELFDFRHDFLIDDTQAALAVRMIFANERSLTARPYAGVRRKVSVSLIDDTDRSLLSTTEINVRLGRYEETKSMRVDFPFLFDEIDTSHTYKVRVRDENSHVILGEQSLLLFDSNRYGKNVSDWFDVYEGGISPCYIGNLYRSLCADNLEYNLVRFKLHINFREMPLILPEVEVRVYYPNGEIESRFRPIECEDFDMNEYYIEMPFFVISRNKGICYTEFICLDFPIAGFVFCTSEILDGNNESWKGDDLECLEEYSLDAATTRFTYAMRANLSDTDVAPTDIDPDSEGNGQLEAEDFDRLLDEFIATTDSENEKDPEKESEDKFETEDSSENEPPVESWLADLTGLTSVKEKLVSYEKFVRFNRLRRENGFVVTDLPLHAMFLGSPGTGKTTVAKKMGIMLRQAGMLSKGHVVVRERATLLGPYYSMEETNTLKAIEEARGGILLIDEAYQLYQPKDPRDPGKFVIETLLTALADETDRDWMLILAGYPDEMRQMFEMNPGFKSRIPDSNIYHFEDFTCKELLEIATRYLERNDYSLSTAALEALSRRLEKDYARRDRSFGNARHVLNLIQTEIIPAMANRIMTAKDITPESLCLIESYDIPAGMSLDCEVVRRIGYRA